MKKLVLLCTISAFGLTVLAQNSVGIGTTTPDANAVLDLQSPTGNQGILVPRLSTGQRTGMALGLAQDGLLVYDLGDNSFWYWDGNASIWVQMGAGTSTDWSLTGNSGTIAGTNFIGTTDAINFQIRTNNITALTVENTNQNIGIGVTPSGTAKLSVRGSAPNDNISLNVDNTYSGASATYGINNLINNAATGRKTGVANTIYTGTTTTNVYGVDNQMVGNSTAPIMGTRNYMQGSGNGINYGVYNDVTTSGTGTQYGSYNNMVNTSNGTRYGTYNNIIQTSAGATNTTYGSYNRVDNQGSGRSYGSNNGLYGTGAGEKYGTFNALANGSGWKFGVYNDVDQPAGTNAPIYGMINYVDHNGSGSGFGVQNRIGGASTASQYAIYNQFQNYTGTGTPYGIYNDFTSYAGASIAYGIYSIGEDLNYFSGDIDFDGALMPNGSAGSAGQVLVSQGAGTAPTWGAAAGGNGIYGGSGTAPSLTAVTLTDNINFDANTFYIDGTNNRVGIGTATPSYPLHVYNAASTGSWSGRFTNGASEVYLSHGSGYGAHINTGNTSTTARYALTVRNADGYHMYIRDDGNIGVGNISTPLARLHFENNVGTGAFDTYSEYQILLYQGASAISSYGIGVIGSTMKFNSNDNYHFDDGGVTRVGFVQDKVGIGTNATAPINFLDIDANDAGASYTADGIINANNESTTGGVGVVGRVNTNNATGAGNRFGVTGVAWYGQSSNYGLYGYGFGGTTSYGIYATAGGATTNWAGYFAGNTNTTGEINRSQTGDANMVPIAYGNISSTGTIYAGGSTNNFTCTRTATGFYEITITGESVFYTDYVAIANGNVSSPCVIAQTNSVGGNLVVRTYNCSGTATNYDFQFVVYKP